VGRGASKGKGGAHGDKKKFVMKGVRPVGKKILYDLMRIRGSMVLK